MIHILILGIILALFLRADFGKMIGLLLLASMLYYIEIDGVFLLIILMGFYIFRLERRINKLENEERLSVSPPAVESSIPQNLQQEYIQDTPSRHRADDDFIAWLKKDWILKLGMILLLIGLGWLTTYAFLNNWIGPMGRIMLGIFVGVFFMFLGFWRLQKYINQGSIFLVLGSTAAILTIFAARYFYGFFTPTVALFTMFLTTVFISFASVKYNNKGLALSGLLLAGIAPQLTAATPSFFNLFLYLMVVVVGNIWVSIMTGRRDLNIAALWLVGMYSIPQLFFGAESSSLLPLMYAFAMIFYLTNTIGILKAKEKNVSADLITASGNGLLLIGWILVAAPEQWKSLIISGWMILFAAGAFLIYGMTKRKEPFYVYSGAGIAMLAAATAVEFGGPALIIAYTIESAIIALVTYVILKDIMISERLSLLMVGPIVLSFDRFFSPEWNAGVLHSDFFALLMVGLSLLLLGGIFYKPAKQFTVSHKTNTTLLISGSIYIYILIWKSLHAGFDSDLAVMISLAIYTIVGIIFYLNGTSRGSRTVRLYGATMVGMVVIRLLLVDVWKMNIAGRILTFFIVGGMLISTAFFGKRNTEGDLISNQENYEQ